MLNGPLLVTRRLGAENRGRTWMPAPFQDLPVDAWVQGTAAWQSRRKDQSA